MTGVRFFIGRDSERAAIANRRPPAVAGFPTTPLPGRFPQSPPPNPREPLPTGPANDILVPEPTP